MSEKLKNTDFDSKAVVAKTDCYEILYQKNKNRIYFTINGFWKSAEVVPDLLKDILHSTTLVRKGFTLLVNFGNMITHPQQLNTLHIEVQKLFVEAGLAYGVYIEPIDKIANFQVEQTVLASLIKLERFSTLPEAEERLESISFN
ncbi:hypothetical protein [uncultured Pontibacter sp.]|uniref:hypothetical protein n=1 Tax=uncultured Pontibacter sp. TaxID=453356 RepID=UPI00262E2149|nr:hypothetical protein [uncultured Pontibacter sp.]